MNKKVFLSGIVNIMLIFVALAVAGCDQGTNTTTVVQYTLAFDTGGGSAIAPVTVNAGSAVSRPDNPARTGYVFDNWYTAATSGSAVAWPLTVNGNATVYARWIFAGQGNISITFSGLPQDETTSLAGTSETLSWTTGTLNISVPSATFPTAAYQWYLDGASLSGATGSSLNKPGTDFTLGRHEITIRIMTSDNRVYSKTLRFAVEQ